MMGCYGIGVTPHGRRRHRAAPRRRRHRLAGAARAVRRARRARERRGRGAPRDGRAHRRRASRPPASRCCSTTATSGPGVKFKDADLIGMPVRVTVGPRALARGCVEVKARARRRGDGGAGGGGRRAGRGACVGPRVMSPVIRRATDSLRHRLIFALDVDRLAEAEHLVALLAPEVGTFKIGKQLFLQAGPEVVRMVHRHAPGRLPRPQVPRHPDHGRQGRRRGGAAGRALLRRARVGQPRDDDPHARGGGARLPPRRASAGRASSPSRC